MSGLYGMIQVMLIGTVHLVLLATVGVAMAWGLSRLMDKANQSRRFSEFQRVLDTIKAEPLPAAIYFGARWLGICILIGWLFSRAV
jgi:hypothetical protein